MLALTFFLLLPLLVSSLIVHQNFTLELQPLPIPSHLESPPAASQPPTAITLFKISCASHPSSSPPSSTSTTITLDLNTYPNLGYRLSFGNLQSPEVFRPDAFYKIRHIGNMLGLYRINSNVPDPVIGVTWEALSYCDTFEAAVAQPSSPIIPGVYRGLTLTETTRTSATLSQVFVPTANTPPVPMPLHDIRLSSNSLPYDNNPSPFSGTTFLYLSTGADMDIYLFLYIKFLHQVLPKPHRFVTARGIYYPPGKTVLVHNHHSHPLLNATQLHDYAVTYQKIHGTKPALIHMNHELTTLERDRFEASDLAAAYDQFGAVYRNYFHEALPAAKVLPLGPANAALDVPSRTDEETLRSKNCVFIGNTNNGDGSRTSLFSSASMREYCDLVNVTALAGSGVVSEGYRRALKGSVFCLCPGGNNFETFRFYEALRDGCIPVLDATEKGWADYGKGMERWVEGGAGGLERGLVLCEGWNEDCVARMRKQAGDARELRAGGRELGRVMLERLKRELREDLGN
jgi:hypothetical protein